LHRPLAFAGVLAFQKQHHFVRCAASRPCPPALITPATARTRFSSTAILTNLDLLLAIKRRSSA
jgi:hypothetical protein